MELQNAMETLDLLTMFLYIDAFSTMTHHSCIHLLHSDTYYH